MNQSFLLLLSSLFLLGCHTAVDIENFDEAAFRSDPNGCTGARAELFINCYLSVVVWA